MAMLRFFNVRVLINDVAYAVAELRITEECSDIENTNSDGKSANVLPVGAPVDPHFETHFPGNYVANVEAKNASFDPDANPFAFPLSIRIADTITLQALTNGADSPGYKFYSLLVKQTTWGGSMKTAQPVSSTGVSDGAYDRPG